MKKYDVIVAGAGPSGMMAAIAASENGAHTALIDKNPKVGKKLLMTGGGRCNVTNSHSVEEIIAHVPGNGRFLHSAFTQFSNLDIIDFFEKNGIVLKEEDHGRMFPITNKSKTIVEALFDRLQELGVDYFPSSAVTQLNIKDGVIRGLETESDSFKAPCVILSTGGRAYPSTGSTGDGYKLARKAGHTITPLYPTESPLVSSEKFISERTLQGISLRDIRLSVLNSKGKTLVEHRMDMLFTHFGISGPAALRCSSFINQELAKGVETVTVLLDSFPDLSTAELLNELKQVTHGNNKAVKNAFASITQERFLLFLLQQAQIDADIPAKQLTEKQLEKFCSLLKALSIQINKTFPIEKSFVTGGGVHLKEINPKTMESKLIPGLYITGELLDINGYTGGYNITCAFVTGHVAGNHAAEMSSYMKY